MTTRNGNGDKIGGWLILFGIGLTLAPFRILLILFTIFRDIFSSEVWSLLTTPGSENYHQLWAPVILTEVAMNSILGLLYILLIYLFFTKKSSFPKFFIGIAIFTLFFIIADSLVVQVLLPEEAFFDKETIKELLKSLFSIGVWGPYLLNSERAKNTFVQD